MNATQLVNEIEQLPPEAQQQVEDFIAFIKMRYQAAENRRQPETTQGDKTIDPYPLFGLWGQQPRNLTDIRKQAWLRSGFEQ